jgi:transmembrane sensor
MTLAEAAQAFARYSETKIVIADPQVADRLVTGLFSASNPIGFARAVAASFDLHAEVGADQVLIRK